MIIIRNEFNNIWDYTELDLLNNLQWYCEQDFKRENTPMVCRVKKVIETMLEPISAQSNQQKEQLVQLFTINCFIHYLETPTASMYNDISSKDEIERSVKEAIKFGYAFQAQQEQLLVLWKASFPKINQILFLTEDKERETVFEKTKKSRKNY